MLKHIFPPIETAFVFFELQQFQTKAAKKKKVTSKMLQMTMAKMDEIENGNSRR